MQTHHTKGTESTKATHLLGLAKKIFLWACSVFFFLSAMAFVQQPLVCILNLLNCLLFLPPARRQIRQRLGINLTKVRSAVAFSILFVLTLVFLEPQHTDKSYNPPARPVAATTTNKQVKPTVASSPNDSFDFKMGQIASYTKAHNTRKARLLMNSIQPLIYTETRRRQINAQERLIASDEINHLLQKHQYNAALPQINRLLAAQPNDTVFLYDRALCYSKTGHTKEAVADLNILMATNNTKATKLHNKINPLRKRIIGYETLCCDGSISYSTGRGTCSHHGGVCEWNHPVYETFREFE